MELNPLTIASIGSGGRRLAAPVRLAAGIAILGALYYFGYLDLRALKPLSHAPFALVAAAGLTLATLPIATWRWAIVLRT